MFHIWFWPCKCWNIWQHFLNRESAPWNISASTGQQNTSNEDTLCRAKLLAGLETAIHMDTL
jgi:hypothetical protein